MGGLFSFISNPMEAALVWLALAVGGAGIAIILFTVIIRLILSPLQIVQLRSARAMQRLQPHLQELRKKHGKDRQKMTEETMKLYREHKVNPAMGCLPLLLQFPVLIGLFWGLRGLGTYPSLVAKRAWIAKFPSCWHNAVVGKTYALSPSCWDKINGHPAGYWLVHTYHHYPTHVYDLYHAHFLWLSNGLGQHDPLYILPVLAGVTQWIQSRMMMQKSSDPQQQTMNMMMNFTPLIIVFFAANYASGLSLYWVTSTIIGILVSIPITGWGSLPRLGWMTPGQTGPAPALMPKPPTRPDRKDGGNADINGTATDADIVLDGEEDSGEEPNGQKSSKIVRAGQRQNSRQSGKRRSGKQRGGRRG